VAFKSKKNSSFTQKKIESHVNECLDRNAALKYATYNSDEETEKFRCAFCEKDLTLYNSKRKEQHLTRCRSENEKSTTQSEEETNPECVICHKNISTLQQKAKINHLKLCAKLKKLKPKEVLELLEMYKKKQKNKKETTVQVTKPQDPLDDFIEEYKFNPNAVRSLNLKIQQLPLAPKTVEQWLNSLNMSEYVDTFISNGYDTLEVCCEVFIFFEFTLFSWKRKI
jgi:hypothetical protein